nr:MAG TPA: hypothetical protein [Bacteriophage sp.]
MVICFIYSNSCNESSCTCFIDRYFWKIYIYRTSIYSKGMISICIRFCNSSNKISSSSICYC